VEKWVFLATLAGCTCLMRASVGDIATAPGGADLILGIIEECRSIAAAAGYPPRSTLLARTRNMATAKASPLTASMLRDIESGAPIEADHIIGDLLHRGQGERVDPPAHHLHHLKAYESRRLTKSR